MLFTANDEFSKVLKPCEQTFDFSVVVGVVRNIV